MRNHNIICVLEDYKSVFAFEKAGNYDGVYHVLNGLISPIDDVNPEDINISSLIKRVDSLDKPEVVIALKSTIEGETTTLYIQKILEGKNVEISRLSYGIPMGAEIDFLDEITLDRALSDRKKIS
jgi:recombination protein RecR